MPISNCANFDSSKIETMKKLIFSLLSVLLSISAFGQGGINLPDDPKLAEEAKRRYVISVDNMTMKNFREAGNAIAWLLKNTPELTENIYINGYKVYEELAESETDPSKKAIYLDSMFTVYDLKEDKFGISDTEINNVAYRYYKFHKEDAEKYDEALKAFERAYEKPSELINNNLVAYMDIVRRSYVKNKNLTDEQVLDIHTQISEVIDARIAQGEDAEKFEKYKSVIDQMLTGIINVDCTFIEEKLYPVLKEDMSNVRMAKRILQLSLTAKCSDNEYFNTAVEVVYKSEPTAGLANIIGRRKLADKDYEAAEKYFREALSLENDPSKKADATLSLARILGANGRKGQARTLALEVVEMDKGMTESVYSFIGQLYMTSFDDCKKGINEVDDRAIFFAAYDAYQKAGNSQGMADARAQFPTKSQIFEQNQKEGDAISVGCWIGVTTTIRTRPTQ